MFRMFFLQTFAFTFQWNLARSTLPPPFNTVCCGIDPSTVPTDKSTDWCRWDKDVCTTLCGITAVTAWSCSTSSLATVCICGNGQSPDGTDQIPNRNDYTGSLGASVCEEWKVRCLLSAGDTQDEKRNRCTSVQCGNRKPRALFTDSSTSSTQSRMIITSFVLEASPKASSSKVSQSDPSNPSNPTQKANPSSPGLSTGAKAGIGIGAALAVLLFAMGVFFLFRRSRKGKEDSINLDDKRISRNGQGIEVDPTNGGAEAAFLSSRSVVPNKTELEGSQGYQNYWSRHGAQGGDILPVYGNVSEVYAPPQEMGGTNACTSSGLAVGSAASHYAGTSQEAAENPIMPVSAQQHSSWSSPSHEPFHDSPPPGQQQQQWSNSQRAELMQYSNLDSSVPLTLGRSMAAPAYTPQPVTEENENETRQFSNSHSNTAVGQGNQSSWPLASSIQSETQIRQMAIPSEHVDGTSQLEEDERRVNEEIAEIERLRALRNERDSLRERIKQARRPE